MRFKTLALEGQTIILQDDGYRIYFKWLDGKPEAVDHDNWILWAEYKHSDYGMPAIADELMKEIKNPPAEGL